MSGDNHDIGRQLSQQTKDIAKKVSKNKFLRKAAAKVLKTAVKAILSIIKIIISKIVGLIGANVGCFATLILLAILLAMLAIQAVVDFFDWFGWGSKRKEKQEIFDNEVIPTLEHLHKQITTSLGARITFPDSIVNSNEGLEMSDVEISNEWIAELQENLTPSWVITAAVFYNHILQNEGWFKKDSWYPQSVEFDKNDTLEAKKNKMREYIQSNLQYYFDHPSTQLHFTTTEETGEEVRTRVEESCWVDPAYDEDGNVIREGYWDGPRTVSNTTQSLGSREIPTQAIAMYLTYDIPYKYITTPERSVSTTTNGDCRRTTYKSYKLKIVDDSASTETVMHDDLVIAFWIAGVPEGSKTSKIKVQDIEYIWEFSDQLAEHFDERFPTSNHRLIPRSSIYVGKPSFLIPVQEGVFQSPTVGRVTSEYGWRNFNGGGFHHGIDIAPFVENTPVVAAADGVVWRSYYNKSYGNVIMIAHEIDGVEFMTVYAHLANRAVSENDEVKKGDFLGIMGTTGHSTGVHLHFEIHENGYWNSSRSNSVNPRLYVNFLESEDDIEKILNSN